MSVDYNDLQASVAQLVVDVSEDPKLKARIENEPHSVLRDRLPEAATKNMEAEQVKELARLVLDGAGHWETLQLAAATDAKPVDGSTNAPKGGFLCPACRPTLYAALVTGGLAGVIASGGAVAAIASAAVPIVAAATGLAGPALTAAIQAALASQAAGAAGLAAVNAILNCIADEACKRLGC